MTTPSPEGLTDKLWKSTLTILMAAGGLFFGWQLIRPVLPALIVLLVLLFIMRLAVGFSRSSRGW